MWLFYILKLAFLVFLIFFFSSAEHVGKINRTILHCKGVTTSISFQFGFKTIKVFPLVSCFCLLVSIAEINKRLQLIDKLIIWYYFGSFDSTLKSLSSVFTTIIYWKDLYAFSSCSFQILLVFRWQSAKEDNMCDLLKEFISLKENCNHFKSQNWKK